MATASDHKSLNCPVCFKRYISPRVLPCFHTFCEKCLDAILRSQAGSGTECWCPLCNASIVPPDPELSVDKWAKSFPLHSLICSVLDSTELPDNGENVCKSLESTEEYGENVREPCKSDGATAAADVWWDISGKASEEYKDDAARQRPQRSTPSFSSFISDINELKTEMETVMSSRTNSLTEIKKEKNEIIREVDKRIDTIIAELDNFRNEFKSDTVQIHQEAENSLLKKQRMVQSFLTNVGNSEEILEITDKKGTDVQKFITLENVTSQLTSHYEQLRTCLEDDMELHLRLEPNVLGEMEDAVRQNPQQEHPPE